MDDEVSLTIIGADIATKPIKVKMSIDTTFKELSEFIIENKAWDTEVFAIRFFRDAKHMNRFLDNDSFESLRLTGDMTVYAKKYDLSAQNKTKLQTTVRQIKVTLIVDGNSHGDVEVGVDITLNILMEFCRDNDHLPNFIDHYQVFIVPPSSKGQKRLWKRSEYEKSFQEMDIDFDVALIIDSVQPIKKDLEFQYTIIGNDLGKFPLKVKMSIGTTFKELSELIIQHRAWDPEAIAIRFYRDAQHISRFLDNDSFESLRLTGDMTVYAEKYDLNPENQNKKMDDEVSLTIIGNDLGNKPIKVKMSIDTTFQELSEFIIEHRAWDPEAFAIRFFRDAKHMNRFLDNDSFESLRLTGDITVYAEKYDLKVQSLSYLQTSIRQIKVTLIVDGNSHGDVEVGVDITLNQLMEFSRDSDHLPNFTEHYQVHIVPPTSKGQKRQWKRSEYGKSLQEMDIDFDVALIIYSAAPVQQAQSNQRSLPLTQQNQGPQPPQFQTTVQNPLPPIFEQPNAQVPHQYFPVQVQAPVIPQFQLQPFQYTQLQGPKPPVFGQPQKYPLPPQPYFQHIQSPIEPYLQAPVFQLPAPQQLQQFSQQTPIYPPPHFDRPNAINASNQCSIISNQMQGLPLSNAQASNSIQIDRYSLSEYQERTYRSIKLFLQDGSVKQLWLQSKTTFRGLSDIVTNLLNEDPRQIWIQFFSDAQCLNRCSQDDGLDLFPGDQTIILHARLRRVQNNCLRLNLSLEDFQKIVKSSPQLKNCSHKVSIFFEHLQQDVTREELTAILRKNQIQFDQTLVVDL